MPREPEQLEPAAIQNGAAELGVPLTAGQARLLARFAGLLIKWNRVYNLTARATPAEVLSYHLLDSLSIAPELSRLVEGTGNRILDVGAGGGLPGIPLAIALPALQFTLVDAVQKKTAFLEQAKAELPLTNVTAVHTRVEAYRAEPFDAVITRAFASLIEMTRSTAHLLRSDGHWLAMKGVYPGREISALDGTAVEMVRAVKLRVPLLDAERHLVILRHRQSHARHL